MSIFIGLYSKSKIVALPWSEAGVECHLFDMKSMSRTEGNIHYHGGDLRKKLHVLRNLLKEKILFVAAFPPCTDLANSGAKHFESKVLHDAMVWVKAMELVFIARDFAELSGAPYFLENPMSVISTLWRSPDYTFDPCDFGGYLPDTHQNALFPDLYPPQDAYYKETWLWCGNGFKMPKKLMVEAVNNEFPGFKSLGGKSEQTKELRSVTPEGFARAIFESNFTKWEK